MLVFQYHDFHLVTAKNPQETQTKTNTNKNPNQTKQTNKKMETWKNDGPIHI